jgi:hypothetical protein
MLLNITPNCTVRRGCRTMPIAPFSEAKECLQCGEDAG